MTDAGVCVRGEGTGLLTMMGQFRSGVDSEFVYVTCLGSGAF